MEIAIVERFIAEADAGPLPVEARATQVVETYDATIDAEATLNDSNTVGMRVNLSKLAGRIWACTSYDAGGVLQIVMALAVLWIFRIFGAKADEVRVAWGRWSLRRIGGAMDMPCGMVVAL